MPGDRHVDQRLGGGVVERDPQGVADGDEQRRGDERPPGGEQPRGERQGEGADGQADDVHADEGRDEGRVGAEAVAARPSGSVRANVDSGICAPSTDMPKRNAVSCTGHCARVGHQVDVDQRLGDPSLGPHEGHEEPQPGDDEQPGEGAGTGDPPGGSRSGPPSARPGTPVMRTKPVQSIPPVARPGHVLDAEPDHHEADRHRDRGQHQQHRHGRRLDQRAEVRAPMITASSSAPTRTAADRRVSSACRPVWAVRRWMIATSSGSHTDVRTLDRPADEERREARREGQDPRAQGGDRGREEQHVAVAPQVAEAGEQRHAQRRHDQLRGLNQFTSAFWIPRWRAMSLKIGV